MRVRIITLLALPLGLHAATFYVSTAGNNSNPGTASAPFLYVSKGVSSAVNPGDSVVIMDGTYSYEGKPTGNTGSGATVVYVMNVGTAAAHITITAQHPGMVILDGGATQSSGSTTCNGVDQYFTINGAAYVDFIGLTIQNTCFMGITGASSNSGHDLTFSQMELRNIARYSGSLPYGQCGMFFNPNMYNIVVDRSRLHDIGRLGGPINPALDHGIYSEANNVTVRNSIFYNFSWGWGVQEKSPETGGVVANNTFYGGNPTYGGAIAFDNFSGTIGTVSIRNNLFLNPPAGKVIHSGNSNVTCTFDHNVANVGTVSDTGGCTVGTNQMNTTASLVNPSGYDFHYQAGSAGIGAGIAVSGVTVDYDGIIRPNPPSVGGYEFVSGTSACDLNADGVVDRTDAQLAINAVLSNQACGSPDLDGDGVCNAVDVQRVINAALGGACRVGP